jgi:hypothetical protein
MTSYRLVLAAAGAILICASAHADPADWNANASAAQRPSTPAELAVRLARLAPDIELDRMTEGGAVDCRLRDGDGNPTRTITTADFGDQAAWLEYLTDGEVDHSVRFVVLPNFEGSPVAGQVQLFITDDINNISTPFGIPTWGLDLTAGPWLLIVRNDRGGQAVCPFNVVAG